MRVTVHESSEALVLAAASHIRDILANVPGDDPAVCLTGGGTAGAVYRRLAESEPGGPPVDWGRFHFFWGDERDVPPDHPDSNYGQAMSGLLAHLPVHATSIHRIEADGRNSAAAATKYDALLKRTVFAPHHREPAFDLMLLGLGEDGHIASIFPGSPLVATPTAELAVATPAAGTPRIARITLTPQAILDARRILVMVSGASKAAAVRTALDGPPEPSRWPAQILRQAADRVEWFIDSAAAR